MPSLLTEEQKEIFGDSYAKYPKQYQQFFDTETSDSEVELYREVGGLGLHIKKAEGSNISLDTPNEGPQTIISNIAYALGYRITHEMIADGKYKKALANALELGTSAGETEETVVINRLNTAFSTASADLLANGQALCSTAQPLSGSGDTVQNRPTTGSSLSESSLIVDMNNIASLKSPRGRKIMVKGDMLIVPQSKDVQAQKLMKQELQVGTANNDINPFGRAQGRLPKGYVVSQFITNDNYYFIRTNVKGLVFQSREKARIMEDLLQRSMQKEVVSYMRFGVGCYDFRSIYGNPGS
jgi:phage major head subunit gpT-like protein